MQDDDFLTPYGFRHPAAISMAWPTGPRSGGGSPQLVRGSSQADRGMAFRVPHGGEPTGQFVDALQLRAAVEERRSSPRLRATAL